MMNSGMMWFDNDTKTSLDEKIQRAAEYYRRKYGRTAEICLVNPAALAHTQTLSGAITVRAQRIVLPGHLWLGAKEDLPLGTD